MWGNRQLFWKVNETSLFSGCIFKFLDEISLLSNQISPSINLSRPAIVRRIVVLPTPEGPSKLMISPLLKILKETFLIRYF